MKKFFLGLLPLAWPACLFFIVVGAHWAAFEKFGSDIPNWDQWDAEGLNLLAPWFEHDHFVQHLFQPHNEHRVVVTKLQNLVLTLANGQEVGFSKCLLATGPYHDSICLRERARLLLRHGGM